MNENEDGGIEVEASPTFFGSGGGGGLVEEDEDDIEQLPQQDDESTMNDESVDNETSYATAGYSYITSNIKHILRYWYRSGIWSNRQQYLWKR